VGMAVTGAATTVAAVIMVVATVAVEDGIADTGKWGVGVLE
jgi:hypothetical protein